ncbi:hypothetical protein N656DRAFT_259940 [Canariomyces notabilis]|uniref:Uncharacterized protein n=1 Tax=Canariomyces notabilis TaxID=2074819 RepID=A0AAN6TLE6_9PEZI|nr:hypothetical protein N656DRAFT_259940 [Canariomyces arenarius]
MTSRLSIYNLSIILHYNFDISFIFITYILHSVLQVQYQGLVQRSQCPGPCVEDTVLTSPAVRPGVLQPEDGFI